jgi:hypothetical protein
VRRKVAAGFFFTLPGSSLQPEENVWRVRDGLSTKRMNETHPTHTPPWNATNRMRQRKPQAVQSRGRGKLKFRGKEVGLKNKHWARQQAHCMLDNACQLEGGWPTAARLSGERGSQLKQTWGGHHVRRTEFNFKIGSRRCTRNSWL